MLVRGDKEGALKQFRYIYNYCIFLHILQYIYTPYMIVFIVFTYFLISL